MGSSNLWKLFGDNLWKLFGDNSLSFLLLFLKFSKGIEGVSLMGTFNGLNKGGELVGGISLTLIRFNEQLLEFSSNWVLLKLFLVVWERFELSDKLDS